MDIEKKTTSIFRLFIEHLVGFSAVVIGVILAMTVGASMALQSGILLQANYTEVKLAQIEETLRENFDKTLLPKYCSYIVVDTNGTIIDSNMSEEEIEKVRQSLMKGKRPYNVVYKQIEQRNGTILFFKYDMSPHFSNPMLHKILPNPELLAIMILVLVIVLLAIMTSLRFSKKLKKSIVSINMATEKIKNRDLDFEIGPSKIKEFNASLDAIDQLKDALTVSLNKQWNDEQDRKSQLSALTHDIKTPLSVIKGNVELLLEEEQSEENVELLSYIQTSSDTIETYLELLMEVVNRKMLRFTPEDIRLEDFMDSVTLEILPLTRGKNIKLNIHSYEKMKCVHVDKESLKRAIVNIVENSIRFSPRDGQIDIRIQETDRKMRFEIIDYGKGFSDEGLKMATKEFYTDDVSRTKGNYGLGLSFAKKIAELHDGNLTVENNSTVEGATVSISFKK